MEDEDHDKSEFLLQLKNELKNNISDTDDILSEYEQHFAFKCADGFSEEEIAAKLGDPAELASQFTPNTSQKILRKKDCNRYWNEYLLIFLPVPSFDFHFCSSYGSCYYRSRYWHLPLADTTLIILFCMPYLCALIYAVSLLACYTVGSCLSVLYCFYQTASCSYKRFHINVIAGSAGKATLPSLPVYPSVCQG